MNREIGDEPIIFGVPFFRSIVKRCDFVGMFQDRFLSFFIRFPLFLS